MLSPIVSFDQSLCTLNSVCGFSHSPPHVNMFNCSPFVNHFLFHFPLLANICVFDIELPKFLQLNITKASMSWSSLCISYTLFTSRFNILPTAERKDEQLSCWEQRCALCLAKCEPSDVFFQPINSVDSESKWVLSGYLYGCQISWKSLQCCWQNLGLTAV